MLEYRDISGFPGYRVGNDGSVWTCWQRLGAGGVGCRFIIDKSKWRRMSPTPNPQGYLIVGLRRSCRSFYRQVHVLVLEAFVGPRPAGMQACHDPDHSPANCDVGNLRWGTPQSNYADRDRHGRTAKGERHGQAKLTAEQAQAIRSRYRAGGTSERKLAAEFGVGRTTVRDIITGHSWRPQ